MASCRANISAQMRLQASPQEDKGTLPLPVYTVAVRSNASQESGPKAFRKKSHKRSGGAYGLRTFRGFERVRIESLDGDTHFSQQKKHVNIPSV
jgi:hypothetical protein